MRALIFASALFLVSCGLPSGDVKDPSYLPIKKPELEWQKGGDSVLRGHYEYGEDIKKSEFKQIIEGLCLKSPMIDPRLKPGAELVTYQEYLSDAGKNKPERYLSKITISEVNGSKLKTKVDSWMLAADKPAEYVFFEDSLEKIDWERNGKFLTAGRSFEKRRGPSAFPNVDKSTILEELRAKATSVDSGEEYSIGQFHFGNGEATKAAWTANWRKFENGGSYISAAAVIPLSTGPYDLSCAPHAAYWLLMYLDPNGNAEFMIENETLHTTIW